HAQGFPFPGRDDVVIVVDQSRRLEDQKTNVWRLQRLQQPERREALVFHQDKVLELGKSNQSFVEMNDRILAPQLELSRLIICLHCLHIPSLGLLEKVQNTELRNPRTHSERSLQSLLALCHFSYRGR